MNSVAKHLRTVLPIKSKIREHVIRIHVAELVHVVAKLNSAGLLGSKRAPLKAFCTSFETCGMDIPCNVFCRLTWF